MILNILSKTKHVRVPKLGSYGLATECEIAGIYIYPWKKKQISVKFVEGPYLINSLEQPKLMRSLQMYRGKCQWKSMIEYKYIFWEVHSSGKCIYSVCAAILRLLKLWFELPFRFKCCWPPSIIQIKPDYFGIEESIFDLIIMMKFKLIHAYETRFFEDKFLTNDQFTYTPYVTILTILAISGVWIKETILLDPFTYSLRSRLTFWLNGNEISIDVSRFLPPISQSLPLQEN